MAKHQFSVEEAIKYRNQGLTHQQIAELLGCSKVWVTKALKGTPKGMGVVKVDATRLAAIAILTEALRKVKEL